MCILPPYATSFQCFCALASYRWVVRSCEKLQLFAREIFPELQLQGSPEEIAGTAFASGSGMAKASS